MYAIQIWEQNIPTFNHFLGSMTPWAHLLNNASSRPACMLIHNMTQEAFKCGINDPSIITKCWKGTPVKVFLAGLNPFSQHFATFFLRDFWQNFSYLYSKERTRSWTSARCISLDLAFESFFSFQLNQDPVTPGYLSLPFKIQ